MHQLWYLCVVGVLLVGVLGAPPAPAPPISISGNKVIDNTGKRVHLHGANRNSAEWTCYQSSTEVFYGPVDNSTIEAMLSWNINVVRIPINADCWLGIKNISKTHPKVTGEGYQQAIVEYVNNLNAFGIYAIIDLHFTTPGDTPALAEIPMPDLEHAIPFWTSVGNTFKGNDAVLFDLFNEPFPNNNTWSTPQAWSCWLNGTQCTWANGITPYPVAGMQNMIDAVRATGATNICLLGGINYANSLNDMPSYWPADPQKNLMASWHAYQSQWGCQESCWPTRVQLASEVPLILGETGETTCSGKWEPLLLDWCDTNGVNGYLAWSWYPIANCANGPSILTDWYGSPTFDYGAAFKAHLLTLDNSGNKVAPLMCIPPPITTFVRKFDSFNKSIDSYSTSTSGPTQFAPSQITINNNSLVITATAKGCPSACGGHPYLSGAYNTLESFNDGQFSFDLQSSPTKGVATSLELWTTSNGAYSTIMVTVAANDPFSIGVQTFVDGKSTWIGTFNVKSNLTEQSHNFLVEYSQGDYAVLYVDNVMLTNFTTVPTFELYFQASLIINPQYFGNFTASMAQSVVNGISWHASCSDTTTIKIN